MKRRWLVALAAFATVVATDWWWVPRIGYYVPRGDRHPQGQGPVPCWMMDASLDGGYCFIKVADGG